MASKCMWCDKKAIRYCDAPIGFEASGSARDEHGNINGLVTGLDKEMYTCDAAMCAEHTTQIGHISGTYSDSIDHCPYHSGKKEEMKNIVMFESEALSRRRSIHADIRRGRLHIKVSNKID